MKGKRNEGLYLQRRALGLFQNSWRVILSEAAMLRERPDLPKKLRKSVEGISRKNEIESIKQERRELCIKDQEVNIPIQRALRASEDRAALKTFKKERKSILREIDDRFNQIWHLEFEIHLL